ncbi:prolyl oligopeptidase family serine peptidase [Massilia sp. IC2-476]|uniref:prolyl oligopeptidase family serine peptidase n=1 Tax=Massilia sp. IC2-476 TaxID=2887199 RepID=UPI001D11C45D|nr:prolyl oligopeptidase family serine peptidase [Massilia sp. IC2-476]MCC2971465.1 prolyl oligopeptidase family serine peptidase [Massilia sp. IC2-476]
MSGLIRLFSGVVLAALTAAAAAAPPVARVEPVTDTHFGEKVVDRYRWMENDKDPDWLPFLKNQNLHTRSVLDTLPLRGELLARIQQLSGDVTAVADIQRAGARSFYQQRPAGANNHKLFVQENGKSRMLVDPTTLDTATSHYSLDWWVASPDGSKLAYGLSKDGSEDSVLHIMDVATGSILPERIANTQAAYPSWLEDSSGFFYNQLTGKVNTPERYLNSRVRFHRIGDDPAKDRILMARGLDRAVKYESNQSPYVFATPHSRHAVLMITDVRQEKRFLVAPLQDVLKGRARWTHVTDFADQVTSAEVHGDELYLLSTLKHPRGRILKVAAQSPALGSAREVVAESGLVIQGMMRARDGLYLRAMDGGIGRVLRLDANGKLANVTLPFDGTVGTLAADPNTPGVLMLLSGWLTPTGIWSIDAAGKVTDTGLTPKPPIDVSAYTTERRFATAKDGTKIPYSLVYRKGLKKDGRNPAFISAYGSYGAAAYTPSFVNRSLSLIDQGAIVGFANVRGGGEYGRDWHRAGQLENKPNTWRDLIAVVEDMHKEGYTAPAHTAIGGRSAGGIPTGMALTERPDLFAAVVSGVGWHNPLRYVAEQNGYGEEGEWGAIRDKAGYKALKSIDSYQAVKDGGKYPAVLLTTGVTDPRVAPFHPAKMAARLQAASASGKPVLLRVDFDAGHGMGSTRAQQDAEAADTYAFILAQTRGK